MGFYSNLVCMGLYSSWGSVYLNATFKQNIVLTLHVLKAKVRHESLLYSLSNFDFLLLSYCLNSSFGYQRLKH